MSGKGDTRRPGDEAAYRDNYDRIFGQRSPAYVPPRFCDQLSDEKVDAILRAIFDRDPDEEPEP